MPQHDLGRIFEPISNRPANLGLQTGTGLNLTITRRFVELMGGTLLVESEDEPRVTFREFELPPEPAGESENFTAQNQPQTFASASLKRPTGMARSDCRRRP